MNSIYFIIIALLAMFYIVHDVRKKRFSIKESFWWIISSLVILFLAIFPSSIDWIAKVFKVTYPPSLFFVFCILFLVFMIFRNCKRISEQQIKITELAQELTILKEKVNEYEKTKK